jgi:NAD(P)H-nitrite reductase large subunit
MKHVILGNGPAGVTAAETIRKNAPDDEILLIGDEHAPPYSRMAIPHLLSGAIAEAGTWLRRDGNHFNRLHIAQQTGRAVHVSSRTRTVKMDDGGVIGFDKLLIATGAAPRVPPIPGIDFPGVHACWTIGDARRIMQLTRPGARVILIGAGFIGCIVMEALAARGVDLTVIERRDRMLPNLLGEGAGRMIRRWCERKGIKVHTSTRVTAIGSMLSDIGAPRIARLSSGEQLPADLIVYSTGTASNIDFLKGSGIRCLQGVVVDAAMQTSVPGVYAAGDCAESFDSVSGRSIISGVQPNAADQAYCAALNMTGKHAFQRGTRQIDVFDTLGLISSSFGQWQGVRGGQWVEFADEPGFRFLRLEFSRDVLIGCNAVGLTEHSAILRSLIQNHVRLGEWKDKLLRDPTLLKEAYTACVEQQYVHQASAFHVPGSLDGGAVRHVV